MARLHPQYEHGEASAILTPFGAARDRSVEGQSLLLQDVSRRMSGVSNNRSNVSDQVREWREHRGGLARERTDVRRAVSVT
jgi:hypothetical protein